MEACNVSPSKDYDTLVLQFKALQRLLKSKQEQITLLNNQVRTLQRECLISQQTVSDLNALRDLNEQLTNRVLFLETACEELSKGCSRALQHQPLQYK
jgi:predicted RNase H-like nuclease (RuvC/YqgF family)